MVAPVLQPEKAEAAPNIMLPRLHRNILLPTGPALKIPILLLPIPEAGVILLLQDHLARLPQVHPAEVPQDQAEAAEAAAAEAAAAEAAAAVHIVVAVVHVVEGDKSKIAQS